MASTEETMAGVLGVTGKTVLHRESNRRGQRSSYSMGQNLKTIQRRINTNFSVQVTMGKNKQAHMISQPTKLWVYYEKLLLFFKSP